MPSLWQSILTIRYGESFTWRREAAWSNGYHHGLWHGMPGIKSQLFSIFFCVLHHLNYQLRRDGYGNGITGSVPNPNDVIQYLMPNQITMKSKSKSKSRGSVEKYQKEGDGATQTRTEGERIRWQLPKPPTGA